METGIAGTTTVSRRPPPLPGGSGGIKATRRQSAAPAPIMKARIPASGRFKCSSHEDRGEKQMKKTHFTLTGPSFLKAMIKASKADIQEME